MSRALDKNAAYPKAFAELKAQGHLPESCELRQVKYRGNLVEQDHRFIKRLTKPGMSFFSFKSAWRTLQGFEIMNIIRKGQAQGVGKGDGRGQVAFIADLFGVVASVKQKKGNPIFQSFLLSFATLPPGDNVWRVLCRFHQWRGPCPGSVRKDVAHSLIEPRYWFQEEETRPEK